MPRCPVCKQVIPRRMIFSMAPLYGRMIECSNCSAKLRPGRINGIIWLPIVAVCLALEFPWVQFVAGGPLGSTRDPVLLLLGFLPMIIVLVIMYAQIVLFPILKEVGGSQKRKLSE